MDVLKQLFEQHFHSPVERVQPLQGQLGGSGRSIIRLSNRRQSAIGVLYGVREENVAFVEFSRHFRRYRLPVPEIYEEKLDQGAYLEQDLGDVTLFDFLSQNRSSDAVASPVVEVYRKVLEILPRFQIDAGRDLNYKICYPRGSFDRQSISWDLNYFKYYFLRLAGIPFNEQALEQDFTRLTKFLLTAEHDYFLYRDFQSRNIMLQDGNPFFVDYQGGRRGALQYDVASLLFDAKADLPPAIAPAIARSLHRQSPHPHSSDPQCLHAALLCICLCSPDAGLRRLWVSRVLRAQSPLPAKRPLCTQKLTLAVAQHHASD